MAWPFTRVFGLRHLMVAVSLSGVAFALPKLQAYLSPNQQFFFWRAAWALPIIALIVLAAVTFGRWNRVEMSEEDRRLENNRLAWAVSGLCVPALVNLLMNWIR